MAFPDMIADRMKQQAAESKTVTEKLGLNETTEPIPFPPPKDPIPPAATAPAKAEPKAPEPAPTPPPTQAPVEAPAPANGESVEIDLGEKKEEIVEKKSISLKGSDFFKEHVDKKPSGGGKKPEPEPSPVKKAITEEKISDKRLEPETEDYELISGMIVEIIDLATSTGFRWWAMDTSDAPYEMTKSKKDKLTKILGEMLSRLKKKFPLHILLIITLVLALYTPFQKANQMRKVNKGKKLPAKKPNTSAAKKTPPTAKKEESSPDPAPAGKKGKPKQVRKPGGVSK